jgi:hypothetical protein
MAEETKDASELIVTSPGMCHDSRGTVHVNIVVESGAGPLREGVQMTFPGGQRRTVLGLTMSPASLDVINRTGDRKRVRTDDPDEEFDAPEISASEDLRDRLLSELLLGNIVYPIIPEAKKP